MNNVDLSALKQMQLPNVGQLGFVVSSIAQSLPYYASLFNIDTWYQPKYVQKHFWSGEVDIGSEIDIILGFSGKVQIELVETSFQSENLYTQHIDKYGERLHHLGFYVPNYDDAVARFKQIANPLLLSGDLKTAAGGDAKFAYFDTSPLCGIIIEVIEVKFFGMNLPQTRFFMNIAKLTGDVTAIKT